MLSAWVRIRESIQEKGPNEAAEWVRVLDLADSPKRVKTWGEEDFWESKRMAAD